MTSSEILSLLCCEQNTNHIPSPLVADSCVMNASLFVAGRRVQVRELSSSFFFLSSSSLVFISSSLSSSFSYFDEFSLHAKFMQSVTRQSKITCSSLKGSTIIKTALHVATASKRCE